MSFEPEFGWAACWPNGTPRPFVIVSSVRMHRTDVVRYIGEVWNREGETPRQGWQRAYRRGCRIVKVAVSHVRD